MTINKTRWNRVAKCLELKLDRSPAASKYTPDLCFAFVFITNRLDPLEKPFYKLGLRVSSGFLNTPIQ